MAKILFVHHSGKIGGAGVSLSNILRMLSSKHEITVYCPANPPDMCNFLRQLDINVISYDWPVAGIAEYSGMKLLTRTFSKYFINIFTYKSKWKEVIMLNNPDLIIVNSVILCWMGLLFRKIGVKSICFVRETFKEGKINVVTYLIKKLLSNTFDGVMFISNYDYMVSKCKAPIVKVIRNTVDIKKFSSISRKEACALLGLDEKCFNVLFVGGSEKIKGLYTAVKALDYLNISNDKLSLVVAGWDGVISKEAKGGLRQFINNNNKYPIKVLRYISNRNLGSKIRFLGTREDMHMVYNACDILIFPSSKPHQARPVFEAGAAKLPVVISDFKQTSEYVKNCVNGLVFKPNSSKELEKSIYNLFSDRSLLNKLGINNFQSTIENHEYSKVEQILNSAIDEVLRIRKE